MLRSILVGTFLRLCGREIIFEVLKPLCKTYVNVTDRQTDGQAERQTDDVLTD